MAIDPIQVVLEAIDQGFRSGIDAAAEGLNKFETVGERVQVTIATLGDRFDKMGKALLPVSGAITAAAGGVFALANSASKTGNAIDKGARAAGLSAEAYQQLGFAIGQVSDLTDDQFGKAMEQLQRRLGQAADGNKPLLDAFDKIGVSQEDLQGGAVDTEAAFQRLTEHMQGLASPAEAAATASALLGEEAGKLGAILQESGGEIDGLRERFVELGLGMSNDAVAASASFVDQMDEMTRQIAAVKNEIGASLIPAMMSLMKVVQDRIVPAVGGFADSVTGLIDGFAALPEPVQSALGAVAGALAVGGPLMIAVGVATKAFLAMWAAATGPVGLAIAAVAAAAYVFVKYGDQIKEGLGNALQWVGDKFREFVDFLSSLPERMMQIGRDMIQGLIDGLMQKWEDLKARIQELGAWMPQWMKDMLESNSPSKVFMRIGQDIGDGLAMGIDGSVGMVQSAMAGINGAVTQSASGMVSDVLGSMGQLFQGSKKFAIAQALVNTWQGATEALKLPFPANLAAFAKTLATGLGAVANIRSATPGGGGGGGGRASGGGGAAAAPAMPTTTMQLNFANDPFGMSERTARMIAEKVNQAQRNGHRVLFQVGGA